jgi:hypothetical protein
MGSRLASHPSHPVRLAPADFSPYDRTCVVSGWGRMADGGKVPEKLMEVNVTVLDNEASSFDRIKYCAFKTMFEANNNYVSNFLEL